MARGRVRIPIVADASGVKKGTAEARRDLASFDKSAKTSAGGLKALTASAGGAGLIIGGGLALGIHSAIDAFKEQEKQNARTSATLKTLGIDNEGVRKQIEGVLQAQVKLSGFQDNELKGSFATLLTSTHSVTGALKLNQLAADLARGRQIDLATAAKVVAKVVDGNVGILNRYGVKIEKGTSVTAALAAAQARYAGQAKVFGDTTAGAAEKASAQIDELQEKLGGQLAPALNEVAGATITFADTTGSLIDQVGGLGPLVAGAAGFGAFKLVAPSILDAGSAVGALSSVAGKKGAGTSMRVLGSAVADSISPMTLAAGGAAILGAGIYEIWKNSENADQAVAGLNSRLLDLKGATQQKAVAKNQVNSAKDYVKATADQEKAARSAARAQHEQVVTLTADVAARKADVAALREHGAEAGKITEAQNKVTSSQNKLDGATKDWHKSLADIVPTVHAHQTAVTNLKSAQQNLHLSTDGVTEAQDRLAQKSRDVIEKANAASGAVRAAGKSGVIYHDATVPAAQAAERFAAMMDKAAAAAKSSDTTTKIADTALSLFARHMGRVPTVKEIRVALSAAAAGKSIDEIQRKLDHLQSKQISVRFNATFGNAGNPINPTKIIKGSASGAYVGGSYSAGDIYPAMVAGEEAILNPTQIGMVDSGMPVMDALAATGAPTIGRGYSGGKAPRAVDGRYGGFRRKGGKWYIVVGDNKLSQVPAGMTPDDIGKWLFSGQVGGGLTPWQAHSAAGWWRNHWRDGRIYATPDDGYKSGAKPHYVYSSLKGVKRTTATPAQKLADALQKRSDVWDLDEAKAQLRISQASAAGDANGNVAAYEYDGAVMTRKYRQITSILANPEKALGVQGAKLTQSQKTALMNALADTIDQNKQDADTIWQLQHPDSGDSSTADTGPGSEAAPAYDATADLQAQLAQAQQRTAVAVRGAQLSDAELAALTGSGDIGSGYGSAMAAGANAPQLYWAQPATTSQVARASNQGNGQQPSVNANRAFIGV